MNTKLLQHKHYFITGTDTSVGKTTFTAHALNTLKKEGKKVIGLKPIAAGCEKSGNIFYNDDALKLQVAASISLPYEYINPVALIEPIAPHLAAKKQGVEITANDLFKACEPALNTKADHILVEGAGGWLVPLNETETLADFAKLLNFPVILVVAIRLGCLNHALLTAHQIKASGLTLAGWVANCFPAHTPYSAENIATLDARLPAPRIATLTCI